jgi:hypothetical protein
VLCGKCGQRIADDSRFCKFCGASQDSPTDRPSADPTSKILPKRHTNAGKVIGWSIAVVLLFLLIAGLAKGPESNSGSNSNSESDVNSAATDLNASDASASAADALSSPHWSYSTDEDKVRGGTTYYATTTSTNSIHQDFPYSSDTRMDMTLRNSPAYGTDVILRISSGQMMCPSYEGCSGSVRFDGGLAQKIGFNGPADSSDDVVFVEGAKGFIAKLRHAKTVVIEKTIYQAGAPQFEFDVRGLKWEH